MSSEQSSSTTASAPAPRTGALRTVRIAGSTGLSASEVEASRAKHGGNTIAPPPRSPWWRDLLEKFDDPVIRILLVAAGLSLAVGLAGGGHIVEAVGILAAVLLATIIAFVNEHQAAREFDLLNRVNDDLAVKVVRDAQVRTVPRRDVVVGDLVMLETGDEIPADGDVLEVVAFEVDESKLTGESMPVTKRVASGEEQGEPDDGGTYPPHRLLRSTLAVDGHAAMRVTAVGDATEIGRAAQAAVEESQVETPLNRQLDRLAKLIGVLGFAIAAVTFLALAARAVATGRLALGPSQWLVVAAAGVSLAVALQRVWVPIILDACNLVGRDQAGPWWLEMEGWKGWLGTVGAGAALFAVLIGGLALAGAVPSSPRAWLPIAATNAFIKFFMIAVVIIVVAVPEGLAMSVTLSLAYSMRKMTATNNLVRRMHACETIGAATVICSDKTGTLTWNQMRLHEAHLAFRGEVARAGDDAAWLRDEPAGQLLADSLSVNATANLAPPDPEDDGGVDGEPQVVGNPTEGALLLWLDANGVDYAARRAEFQIERQWAFSTERKVMATAGRLSSGERLLLVKGAPEVVLGHATSLRTAENEAATLDDTSRADQAATLQAIQGRGMRTLGVAVRPLATGEALGDDLEPLLAGLSWLGFLAIADPVRPDVPDAIERCRQAGIDVKIVTGDNAETAKEVARQVTLLDAGHPGSVLTGREFSALDDEAASARLEGLRVLARARPADKLRLVRLLQARGEVVAVTGDGTNDAPALNHADVGLAMGRSGTAVAKEAADIVLLDDSFPSIVNAVKWGRSLYLNIQKFLLFQLTINVAACLIAMLGPFIGVDLPLTVMQMLWVNLIMDTFAALALATEPPRAEVLLRSPRDPNAFIITRPMAVSILGVGGAFLVLLVVALKTRFLGKGPESYELTLFFNFFVFLQFWNLFNARSLGSNRSGFAGILENPAFALIVVAIAIGQVLIIQFGGQVFRTVALSWRDWAVTAGLPAAVAVIGETVRAVRRLRLRTTDDVALDG